MQIKLSTETQKALNMASLIVDNINNKDELKAILGWSLRWMEYAGNEATVFDALMIGAGKVPEKRNELRRLLNQLQ